MKLKIITIALIFFVFLTSKGQTEKVLYFEVDGKNVIIPDSNFFSYYEKITVDIDYQLDSFYMFSVNENLEIVHLFLFKDEIVLKDFLKRINSKKHWFLEFQDSKTLKKYTFYQFKLKLNPGRKIKINNNRKVRSYVITELIL